MSSFSGVKCSLLNPIWFPDSPCEALGTRLIRTQAIVRTLCSWLRQRTKEGWNKLAKCRKGFWWNSIPCMGGWGDNIQGFWSFSNACTCISVFWSARSKWSWKNKHIQNVNGRYFGDFRRSVCRWLQVNSTMFLTALCDQLQRHVTKMVFRVVSSLYCPHSQIKSRITRSAS